MERLAVCVEPGDVPLDPDSLHISKAVDNGRRVGLRTVLAKDTLENKKLSKQGVQVCVCVGGCDLWLHTALYHKRKVETAWEAAFGETFGHRKQKSI